MKKLIFIAALILLTGITFGQVLLKGTLIGTHQMTITLKPGVTMEQYMQFFSDRYLPELNRLDPDWQVYLVKGIRGNIFANSFGLIHVLKSEQTRAKYYNADGSVTELFKSGNEKLKPVMNELNKLGTYVYTWTDWVVQ